MYAHQQKRSLPETASLRKAGGAWLKSLREKRGLSQSEMAVEIDVESYRFISQIENGRLRIPPDPCSAFCPGEKICSDPN